MATKVVAFGQFVAKFERLVVVQGFSPTVGKLTVGSVPVFMFLSNTTVKVKLDAPTSASAIIAGLGVMLVTFALFISILKLSFSL